MKSLFKKSLFRNMIRAPNSLDPDQVIFLGPIWVQIVYKAEDIDITNSINAIYYYLLRGSEPGCLFMWCKNVT